MLEVSILNDPQILIKEEAAWDKRYWLRISNACNQKCIFCLDIEHHDGTFSDLSQIEEKIKEVRNQGYTRLVVSGGEASIHPDFLPIIRAASAQQFSKIQTVTNGRMFSYRSFALKAKEAGLTEVTFSIHGHVAKLHDMLTATPGAFDQAMRGIMNLLHMGGVIINIDICVNKKNYRYLEDMILLFSGLGIYEFDLLHIIPFGSALGNRHALFYTYEEAAPYLDRAFSFRKKPGYYIWTNRFPAAYCEGHEELIQDPHKFYDEIGGRQDMYEHYDKTGTFDCYPHHCGFCFIRKFCRKFLYTNETAACGANLGSVQSQEYLKIKTFVEEKQISSVQYRLPFADDQINILLKDSSLSKKCSGLYLFAEADISLSQANMIAIADLAQRNKIPVLFEITRLQRDNFIFLESIMKSNTHFLPVIVLNHHNNTFLSEDPERVFPERLLFKIPSYEKGSLADAEYKLLHPALQLIPDTFSILNCAPCLHPGGIFESPNRLHLDSIGLNGKTNEKNLVGDFIQNDYFSKGNRCRLCSKSEVCRGMHINYIRTYGFVTMNPL